MPSKYRNVSSLCLKLNVGGHYAYLLLDCGEGTCGQIHRLFTEEEEKEFYINLDVWMD